MTLTFQRVIDRVSLFLLLALMTIAGIYDAINHPAVIRYAVHLGYPPYFITWIGIGKIIGVVCFLFLPRPRIREWVFAIFFLDMAGGLISHIACHDPIEIIMLPVIGLLFWTRSYINFCRTTKFIKA